MSGRGAALGLLGEHLVQLLAGPEANELYLYVLGPHHLDHLRCQVYDSDGTAHLQNVSSIRVGHGARLKDQGDGLGYGHEVACHLRMGDRYRPPGLYLSPESRYNAPPAPEDVSEAHRGVERLKVLIRRRAHDHLRQALRRPHDVRRVDSLVGRDIDELLCSGLSGGPRHVQGTHNVVVYGLGGVQLHEWYMFVGGSVKDQLGLKAGEKDTHLLHVRHVSNDELGTRRAVAGKLFVQVVQSALVAVEEDQLSRA